MECAGLLSAKRKVRKSREGMQDMAPQAPTHHSWTACHPPRRSRVAHGSIKLRLKGREEQRFRTADLQVLGTECQRRISAPGSQQTRALERSVSQSMATPVPGCLHYLERQTCERLLAPGHHAGCGNQNASAFLHWWEGDE